MFALLPAALLSAGLMLDGSVRAEGRDGPIVAGQDPRAAALAVDLNGRTAGPDAALLFGLLPSAVFAHDTQLFARGYLEVDLRLGRDGSLRARQRGGYGTADLSPVGLAASSGPPAQGEPAAAPGSVARTRFVRLQESSSSLELDLLATRRLRLLASAAWNVSGGANAEAMQVLPLSRGPQARAAVEWAATRIDTLRLETAGYDTRYSNGNRVSVASVLAGWRTAIFRGSELALAAGAGVGRASHPPGTALLPESTLPYAVATADARFAPARDFALALGAGLEPSGDPLTGDLIERGTVRGSAVWGGNGRIAVAAKVAASVAATSGGLGLNDIQAGDRFVLGDLTVSVPVTRHSGFDIGARGSWLSRPLLNQPKREWIAFVGYSAQLQLLQ
jgi:hypothetical protein